MAVKKLTCESLYKTHPTFQAGMNKWHADRRCPLEMPDFLEELGLSSSAACARWCLEMPDRSVLVPLTEHGEREGKCGPWPTVGSMANDVEWYWQILYYDAETWDYACIVPTRHVPKKKAVAGCYFFSESEIGAVLWLLDNWIP